MTEYTNASQNWLISSDRFPFSFLSPRSLDTVKLFGNRMPHWMWFTLWIFCGLSTVAFILYMFYIWFNEDSSSMNQIKIGCYLCQKVRTYPYSHCTLQVYYT